MTEMIQKYILAWLCTICIRTFLLPHYDRYRPCLAVNVTHFS